MCKNWTIRIKNNENRFSSFSFFPLNSLLKTFFTPLFRFYGIHYVPLSRDTKFSGKKNVPAKSNASIETSNKLEKCLFFTLYDQSQNPEGWVSASFRCWVEWIVFPVQNIAFVVSKSPCLKWETLFVLPNIPC